MTTLQDLAKICADAADRLEEDESPSDTFELYGSTMTALAEAVDALQRVRVAVSDARDLDTLRTVTGEVRTRIDTALDDADSAVESGLSAASMFSTILHGRPDAVADMVAYMVGVPDYDRPLGTLFTVTIRGAAEVATEQLREAATWLDSEASNEAR